MTVEEEVRKHHRPVASGGLCFCCAHRWPCSAIRVADRLREVEEALAKYGRHGDDCNVFHGWGPGPHACDCGLIQALSTDPTPSQEHTPGPDTCVKCGRTHAAPDESTRLREVEEALRRIEEAARRGSVEVEGVRMGAPLGTETNIAKHHFSIIGHLASDALSTERTPT